MAAVEASTEGAAASTAVDSGDITEAGVALAGMGGGAVMAGTEAGVGTAGDIRAGESALALAGVPIGRATRMRMAIPTTPIIRITHTMGRTRMRQPTRISITVATEMPVTTRSSKIRTILGRRGRLA
jgi:hypothetical protein